MNIDTATVAPPLSITFDAPGRATINITGNLTQEVLPMLQESIGLAKGQIETAAAASAGGKLKIFMDLSGFLGEYDAAALEAMAEFAVANSAHVAKTAVFGGPDTGAMAAEVAAALAGRENIKTFNTKAESEAWLES